MLICYKKYFGECIEIINDFLGLDKKSFVSGICEYVENNSKIYKRRINITTAEKWFCSNYECNATKEQIEACTKVSLPQRKNIGVLCDFYLYLFSLRKESMDSNSDNVYEEYKMNLINRLNSVSNEIFNTTFSTNGTIGFDFLSFFQLFYRVIKGKSIELVKNQNLEAINIFFNDETIIKTLNNYKSAITFAILKEIDRYNKLATIDIPMSLVCHKKILYFVMKSTCSLNNVISDNKTLETMISELINIKSLSTSIESHCKTIIKFSNIALYEPDSSQLTSIESDNCCNSLKTILKWYITKILPNIDISNKYDIIRGNEITLDDLLGAISIDNDVYDEEARGNLKICNEWLNQNPDIYTIIKDSLSNKVIGYINAMPLVDKYYDMIKSGVIIDIDLPAEAILKYDLPDYYRVYVASVAVLPEYQNTFVFKILYDAFIDSFISLAKKDIYISEISADAISEQGKNLCNFIRMNKINITTHNTEIYSISFLPPKFRITTQKGKYLKDLYSDKYEQIKDFMDFE